MRTEHLKQFEIDMLYFENKGRYELEVTEFQPFRERGDALALDPLDEKEAGLLGRFNQLQIKMLQFTNEALSKVKFT